MDSVSIKMEQGVDEGVFPGAVLLVSLGDSLVFHRAFGRADIFSNQIMTLDSIFDLASLTKPLATALSVSRLIEKGLLFLQQPIGTVLKSAQGTDKHHITVESLLRHCSGLPAHRSYYKSLINTAPEKRKDILREMIIKEPLEYEPETREIYSDLGYMLLAWVVETVSDKRLDVFAADELYHPLGVQDLFFIESCTTYSSAGVDSFLDNTERFVSTEDCPWRKKIIRGQVHDDNAWVAGGIDGHAGLFGTAHASWMVLKDILRILKGGSGKIISRGLLNRLVVGQDGREKVAGFDTPSKNCSSCGKYFSSLSLGHLGFTGTSFWMDPENELIVILLTNRVHPTRNNLKIRTFRPKIHDLIYERLFPTT